jgi:hypothetical protein
LGIVPSYDTALDTRALQETAVRRKVSTEMGVALAPDQAPGPINLSNPKAQKAVQSLHEDLTKKSLLKKLAGKFNKPPAGYYEEALENLITSLAVSESDLQSLALSRGKAIQQSLVEAGVAAERLRLEKGVMLAGDAKTNARRIISILMGDERGAARDMILLNASAALFLAGIGASHSESLGIAAQSIDSGAALGSLTALREA